MGHFFDTSVFIGYSLCDDQWRKAAENLLHDAVAKFTSTNVTREYHKKLNHIFRARKSALIQFRDRIKDSLRGSQNANFTMAEIENIVPQLFHDEINTDWLKKWALRLASKSSDKFVLCEKVDKFMDLYSRFMMARLEEIDRWCTPVEMYIECSGRLSDYPDILQAFVGSGMMNEDDNEIILDAHDLCSYCGEPIDLVTGDFKDYKRHETTITTHTRIRSVIFLGHVPI